MELRHLNYAKGRILVSEFGGVVGMRAFRCKYDGRESTEDLGERKLPYLSKDWFKQEI